MTGPTKLIPSCTISILFAEHPEPTFTYLCRSMPPPWDVSAAGDINPSARSRIIQFDLQSEPAGAKFIWIRSGISPQACASQVAPFVGSPITVHKISATRMVIDDNQARAHQTIWYSPGIKLGGREYWGDPKIYNPPDD